MIMINGALIFYGVKDSEEILNRFRRVGVTNITLDDVADSLSFSSKGMSFSEARQNQAGLLAERLEKRGMSGKYAYDLSYRVLAVKGNDDLPYLQMWDEVCRQGIRPSQIFIQADAKREILANLFEKFRDGGKQDLRGRTDAYIGKVFQGVYRGAQKRAKEYGLIGGSRN